MKAIKNHAMDLYVLRLLTITGLLVVTSGLEQKEQCSGVLRTYTQLGYPAIDVPSKAKNGKDLKICNKGYTCCTNEMEENFEEQSSVEFAKRLANATDYTRATFITATAQFNDFFLALVEGARVELDAMFSLAYGLLYNQNNHLFNQLFEDFESYYKGGDINLTDAMNKFFENVFVRMFALQSPEYDLSNSYLKCVKEQMHGLKPFGDIPETLTKKIRQAFVAARTFVQGLAVGRNVALKMAQVQPTDSCAEAYTKQSFCSLCQGLTSLRPCHEYCMNVMKGCLAYHAELEPSWTKYIGAMDALAARLEGSGSFNIEVVMTPLKDLISEAIMEYHGNSKDVSDKVFSNNMCGRPPPLGRGRRNKRRSKSRQKSKSPAYKKGTLNSLVSNIRTKIGDVETIWTDIPESMCKGRITANKGASRCWNGEDEGRYTKRKMDDGLAANSRNPEVWVSTNTPNPIIQEQIKEINEATKHLNNAKLGIDVDWLNFDISVSNVPASEVQMGGGDAEEIDYKTTTSKPAKKEKPKEIPVIQSGSGDLYIPKGFIDTEDGDDDYIVPAGSGWKSDIVHITPFEKPRKPNSQNGGDKIRHNSDGSGSLVNYGGDDKPVAVYFIPPISKNGDEKEEVDSEGSGPSYSNFPFNYDDDEDRYIPNKNVGSFPQKPNIIQAGSTQHNFASQMTTSSKSVANIHNANIYFILLNSLFLIAYVVTDWVT